MQLKNFLAATAAFVALSHPIAAYHVKRAGSPPLIVPFPGQGALPTAAQVQSASAGNDSIPFENVQGDILMGMKKQKEKFVFFHINDASAFKIVLKTYAPVNITSVATIIGPSSAQPQAFVNVAFSYAGLGALGVTDDLGDSVFSGGQYADAPNLGDDTSTWDPAFKGTNIDGVFLIFSSQDSSIEQYYDDLRYKLGNAWTVVYDLDGAARPGDQFGHEHFGYLDGISNPLIKGFGEPLPGQDYIDPGIILVGRANDTVTNRPAWALDGSFLAFRKLKQLVPEFHKYTLDNALQNQAGNLSTEEGALLLGSRMFGRWNSGAPIDLTPDVDDPALGNDPHRNNDFNYIHPGEDLTTDQSRCPFTAHIRKTNPRDLEDENPQNPLVSEFFHAIRAGTPYGPEVSDAETSYNTTQMDRGLAFVEYQSNIGNGFRFQQLKWANNPGFPFNKTSKNLGLDPVIGQNKGANRITTGLNPLNFSESLSIPDFIISNGGEYFFSPSITSLVETIAA